MINDRAAYMETRTALLARITTVLQDDPRFIAAWLAGSFGRGEQQWYSDLDIHVVVADQYSEQLCIRQWVGGAKTTDERLALFQQFGEPVVIYDSHNNNTMGGTFTYVLYREAAINVDWMLIPPAVAHLEHQSLILFQKAELPAAPPEELPNREECIASASLQVGFFWMIAASNIQNLYHHDEVQFHLLLRWLEESIRAVRAASTGNSVHFTKASHIQLYSTQKEQVATLRMLCDEMETLMPLVVEMGGYVPNSPRNVIEMRLALLENNIS